MFRNRFRLFGVLVGALGFVLGAALLAGPHGEPQGTLEPSSVAPSVLLITLDTLRADHLGCYGYREIKTPAIDRLAAEGVRFENAYAQVPITLPSHAVILTGTYPMFNRVRDFTSPGLPQSIPTMAEVLRRNGDRTAAFVSSFVLNSMWGLNRGFELYDDEIPVTTSGVKNVFQLERRGDLTVDRLLAWLGSGGEKPFFAWLHLYDPHSPYNPPEPFHSEYASRPYDGEIAFDDFQVGRVVNRLHALKLYNRTLIVLMSDHGESLGEHGEAEHGFFVYNATLRIPLILKLPGSNPSSRVVSQPVGTVDVAPTIARVAGIAPGNTLSFQGRSLLRWTEQASAAELEPVYAESYYPRNSFGWHELRALITTQFKFVESPRAELYDLRHDPGERSNLFGANSAVGASFREQLQAFERRFENREPTSATPPLDLETLEKLKSLGYVTYRAGATSRVSDDHPQDPKDKIYTLNRILRAGDLTRLGRHSEAERLLARLEETDPDLYVVPFERGENFFAWQKPEAALAEFLKTLSLNPTFDQALVGLGRANFFLMRDEEATGALALALRFNPNNFLARVALAEVYWRRDLLNQAESEIVRVVTSHPGFAEAHAVYGIILAKERKYREAIGEIERSLRSGYFDAVAYNYLGVAYSETGDRERAIRAYKQALALNPHYAAACLNLALQYRKQGALTKAQNYYRKTCELSSELCKKYAGQFKSPR